MRDLFLRSRFVARKSRRALLSGEPLEARLCLSAAPSDSPPSIVEIEWNGNSFETFEDSWVARTNSPVGEHFITTANLPTNWFSDSIGDGFHRITSPGATVAEIAGWASQTPGIAYIEPNAVIHALATPTDPDYGLLWGLENTGQSGGLDGWDQGLVGTPGVDISANEAWDITTGSRDVVIAVIDSGVDYLHPDLQDNMWLNPNEIAGNGVDDDGNGYIDDIYGWDFVNDDNDPMDGDGHGTHVAGTIGAAANNGEGVVGVAWDVQIMAMKGLSDAGFGSIAGLTSCIVYVTAMRRAGINVVASNNSWGGGPYSQATFDAIEDAGSAGVLFVAAAGNDMRNNNDTNPVYPASYDSENIISVAATARDNTLAPFSNIGRQSVDLAAPGVGIWSTTPGGGYGAMSGTSMASPHVAGVVALLAANQPDATSGELREAILEGARLNPNPRVNGLVATNGQLNAYDSLTSFVPPTPTAIIAPVTPNPRFTGDSVNSIQISFDLPVQGFDLADLALERDGVAVALDVATLSATDAKTYTLSDLAGLTTADGSYTITLVAAGSDIIDTDQGIAIENDAITSWDVVPPPPFEMNDSLATAPEVDLSTGSATISAFLGDGYNGRADVDLFAVQLDVDSAYEFDVSARSLGIGSRLDSFLRIFDSSGRQVAVNDDSRGSLDSHLVFTPSESGRYYAGITAYGNVSYNPSFSGSGRAGQSSGAYSLSIGTVALPPPTPPTNPPTTPPSTPPAPTSEPNDSIATATAIVFNGNFSSVEGVIGDGDYLMGDVDLFSIEVAANTQVVIDVDARDLAVPSRLDSYLRLFDSSGQLIAANDDAGGTLDSRLSAQLTGGGTYYVGVSAFGNSRYNPFEAGSSRPARTSGEYVLTVATDVAPPEPPVPPPPPPTPPPPANSPEPNDSAEQATALIPLDGVATIQGTIGDGHFGMADVDVYAIQLVAGTDVIASIAAQTLENPSSLDSYLRLFDGSGRLVAANDDYGSSYDSRLFFTVPESGMYYLGVSAFGNYFYDLTRAGSGRVAHTSGDYELTFEVSEGARSAAFSTMTGPSSGSGSGGASGGSTQTLTR